MSIMHKQFKDRKKVGVFLFFVKFFQTSGSIRFFIVLQQRVRTSSFKDGLCPLYFKRFSRPES